MLSKEEMKILSENEDFNILDYLLDTDIDFEKVTFELEYTQKGVKKLTFTKQQLIDLKNDTQRGDK